MGTKVKLTFLLMGKTGHGKSATGNSILDNTIFKTSASSRSVTKEVLSGYEQLENYTLLVVDGPGVEDPDVSHVEDKEAAVKNMNTALAMCHEGVDAFLFVFKFGSRFTAEDVSAWEAFKDIFGDDYFKHVIVVVTGGDLFQDAMEEEHSKDSFDEWFQKQTGEFRKLYDKCEKRVVLFNNREKNKEKREAQRQQLVQLAHDLQKRYGCYTSECFEMANDEREKMIINLKAPILRAELQEQIGLLTAEINKHSEQLSDKDKHIIEKRIQDLKQEVEVQDKGYGVLDDVRKLVQEAEKNLHNVDELHRLGKKLEHIRLAKTILNVIGIVCVVVGGAISAVVPVAGAGVVAARIVLAERFVAVGRAILTGAAAVTAGGSVVATVGTHVTESMEDKAKHKRDKLQAKKKI